MRLPRIIIFLLIGFLSAQFIFYYPNLPAQMASHFDASGKPNNLTAKENFIIFEAVIMLVIVFEFAFLPRLIQQMPDALINLPNKDFWLAKERRAKTFAVIRVFFDWLAVALLALFIAVNQFIIKANINRNDLPLIPVWLAIAAFLFFTIGWMIKFNGYFKIKNYES